MDCDYQLTRWMDDIDEVGFAIDLLKKGRRSFEIRSNRFGKRAVFVAYEPINPAKFTKKTERGDLNAV